MTGVAVGDQAPRFSAVSHTGEPISLANFLGKQVVVLYFYPRDGTGICTAEACAFRDAFAEFATAGAVVIGVSRDSTERHRQFIDRQRLPFLLISDHDRAIEKAFGVPKLFGFLPGRTTYVIDKSGVVRHIFTAHFSAGRHVDEALRVVRDLVG